MTERVDGDRITITGYSGGSHFPREQKQMNYNWEADGTSSEGPFQIDGSVYGRSMRFIGEGTVTGSILGRGDVRLENHTDGKQRFMSGLSVNGNLVAKSRGAALQESLAGDLNKADYVLRGDVLATNVVLENAIIFGNIEANRIHVTSCIVFGALIAKEKLTVTASTLLYYHAPEVVFEGPCMMVNAMGESNEPPVFATYEDGGGSLWDADLRFYPAVRPERGTEMIMNRPWTHPAGRYDAAKLYPETDWVRVDVAPIESDDPNAATEERHVLTISGRALNFKELEEHLDDIFSLLKSGLEFEHYHPNTQQEVRRIWDEICTDEEKLIMNTVNAPFERT